MRIIKETRNESDGLVRRYLSQDGRIREYLLLKLIELVPILGVFVARAKSLFKHEVLVDDPSVSIPHFLGHEGRTRLSGHQKFKALCVGFLLFIQHELYRVEVGNLDHFDKLIDKGFI